MNQEGNKLNTYNTSTPYIPENSDKTTNMNMIQL